MVTTALSEPIERLHRWPSSVACLAAAGTGSGARRLSFVRDSSMTRVVNVVRGALTGRGLQAVLLKGGAASLVIKAVSTLLGMWVAILLARGLGPDNYGVYTHVMAIVSVLALPAQVGLPALVVRETAKAQATGQWGLMRGLWRWASLVALGASLVVVGLAVAGGWCLREQLNPVHTQTMLIALLMTPVVALGTLRGSALQGLKRLVAGQLPEQILRPLVYALVLTIFLNAAPGRLTPVGAMGFYCGTACLVFAVGAILLWRARPAPLRAGPPPVYEKRAWWQAVLPLSLISGVGVLKSQTDILMLGWLLPSEQVGIYRAAVSVAGLVAFGLQAVNMVVAPYFAKFHAEGDRVRLQKLVTRTGWLMLALAVPVVMVLLVSGGAVLALLFGPVYREGSVALAIMAAGQLVNVATGSVGVLLNMTGHEKDILRGSILSAVLNVVLNLVLIPRLGVSGAAVASSVTLSFQMITLCFYVRQRLGIRTLPALRKRN